MMNYFKSGGSLLRWGQTLVLCAPLVACAQTSSNSNPASADMVASNDNAQAEDADMKQVRLHVFGMT